MYYLIKRGPRPENHRAPFHPVIICGLKRVALWQVGATNDKSWLWSSGHFGLPAGWLLLRWNGLDIDYGHVVREVGPLPDGTHTGFFHDRDKEPWTLIDGAVWWHTRKMPTCLADLGVKYPEDEFTQQRITDNVANDGMIGFRRDRPPFWPEPKEES